MKITSDLDIIQKAGAWYSEGEKNRDQGSENAKNTWQITKSLMKLTLVIVNGLIEEEEGSKKQVLQLIRILTETLDLGDALKAIEE